MLDLIQVNGFISTFIANAVLVPSMILDQMAVRSGLGTMNRAHQPSLARDE